MTSDQVPERFLVAIELHRQRDELEATLRGIVEAFDLIATKPVVAQLKLMAGLANAKLLLLEIHRPEEVAGA